MNTKSLEYFITVVDENSYTRAAERLFISQSAISKAIAAIEEDYGVPLLRKEKGAIYLTPAGKLYYEYAKGLLNELAVRTGQLKSNLNRLQKTVRIGLPPSAGIVSFANIISNFLQIHPEIQLTTKEYTSSALLPYVDNGELDLGIVVEPFEDPRFEKLVILKSEAVLVLPKNHPWNKRNTIAFRELKDQPFIMVSPDYMYYDRVIQHFEEAGIAPVIQFHSYQWELLINIIVSSRGMSILPAPLIEQTAKDRVHTVHLKDPEFPWGLSIIWKKDEDLRPGVKLFLEDGVKASLNKKGNKYE